MCEILKKVKRVTKREIVAWKCINATSTKTKWQPLCCGGSFKRGEWAIATGAVGFNCYLTRTAARNAGWSTSDRPVRVRIRKIEGYGNHTDRVVFAREIWVPKGR